MTSIARLSTTPVKGTALHHPARITLTATGAVGDRSFYLVDGRGNLFSGKQCGSLVQLRADHDGQRLTLRFPDGRTVGGGATEHGEAVHTSFWGRIVDGHLVDGPYSAALSEFVGEPVTLIAADRPGEAADGPAVTLVSTATIEALRAMTPGGEALDHRRFRMLIEMDGCGPHEEDNWAGRRLRIGSVTLRVDTAVPRCSVVNQSPETGASTFSTLKAITRYRAALGDQLPTPVTDLPDKGWVFFGMYATVEQTGDIAVGDRIERAES